MKKVVASPVPSTDRRGHNLRNVPYSGRRGSFVVERALIVPNYLAQRAAAAFFAIDLRLRVESAAARAFPPFKPPRRPRSTAFTSLPAAWSDSVVAPVARSTMNLASWFVSRGRLGRIETQVSHRPFAPDLPISN